jgi:hypothetical protein
VNRLLTLSAALAFAFAAPALAKDAAASGASAPMTKQQSKMGDCNKQAADKKGDERKAFMSSCLSAAGTAPAPAPAASMTQQQKMTKCNADAKGKKGDERKAFMSSCLSG